MHTKFRSRISRKES